MPRMTAARYLAEIFRAYGITHCFFMDAILRRALAEMEEVGIRRVLGHSEKAVAYMADGFARVSGRPAVCMAQSVGAANLAAGLQDAFLGQSPVVALTGRHVAPMQYRNAYQELPHEPMYRSVTKFHAKIEHPAQVADLVRQAFREATAATPRPVHLDVAGYHGDVFGLMEHDFRVLADDACSRIPSSRPSPAEEEVRRAADALARAERPVIVADRGVTISGAEAAVAALAERLQSPFVVTPDAKCGALETHPLYAGVVGLYGRSCANRLVFEADAVVFAGSNTSDHTTCNWTVPKDGTPIVQIDPDPVEIGRNYSGVVGVNGDVRTAVAALARAVPELRHDAWVARSQALVAEWRGETDAMRNSTQTPLRPERLCLELTNVLPEDAILVADTGYSAIWTATMVELRHPGQRYFRAAGSLGWSFPAALGAKLAAPDNPVICFCGDGAFFYHLPELETARRLGIKVVTVVNNNSSLGQGVRAIREIYAGRNGNKEETFAFRPTDFAAVARSFDCFGTTVERAEDFAPAFAEAMASDLPAVIDVRSEFGALTPLPWVPGGP